MDYDSSNDAFIVGGYSESTDVVAKNAGTPILIYVDEATGNVKWNKQIYNIAGSTSVIIEPKQISKCSI